MAPQYAAAAVLAPVYVTAQAFRPEDLRLDPPSGAATTTAHSAKPNAPAFQPWMVSQGDETVHQALLRWSLQAQWTFSKSQWLVPVDIPVHESAQVWASSFEAAVRAHSRAASTPTLANECLRWAIKHHTERECVMEGQDMLRTALRRSHGTDITLTDLKRAVKRSLARGHLIVGTPLYRKIDDRSGVARPRAVWIAAAMEDGTSKKRSEEKVRLAIARGELIPSNARYTTQMSREREKRILQIEREGRGTLSPVLLPEAATRSLDACGLTLGQQAAAELILTTTDRFIGVQGKAGTGKSHMLAQVICAAEAAGYTVRAVASYAKQVQALREHSVEARTLASVMAARQKERFKLDGRTLLVIDEAGVVPVRLMEWIMRTAEADGARVVLLGDTGQTKAIEAGKPFQQLQDAGMATALMSDIVRQKEPVLRESVELAACGHASASLQRLSDRLGAVRTIDDDHARYNEIAYQYAALPPDERSTTLIITGTNKSRNALNDATHEALGLAGRGFEFNLLTRRDTTQAERRVAKYFVAGDIIQPERSYGAGNLLHGEMYRVLGATSHSPNQLEVEHVSTKQRRTFNPARTTKISVYEPVRSELSVGDCVRVTRNNAELDLINGDRFEVLAATPTSVTVRNGTRRVTLNASTTPLHLDRSYASTSHSAQGLTCNRVLYNAESFIQTTQRDSYYVAISRSRIAITVFTDNSKCLTKAVNKTAQKSVSLDVAPHGFQAC
ncbi:hypothetical protein ASB57_09200 [Bordetella sp. N]|nr:hypothetical protein ASB57_09200 [Bordetella sp. N]